MISWKTGSRERRSPELGALGFWGPAARKWCPKGAFLKTMKIENGTKNQFVRKVRRWDPLKTIPGSGFEKTWKFYEKTIGKSMFFDGPKPLKTIEKHILFLILGHSKKQWKTYAKGDLKSHVLGSKMATWASLVRLIVWFLMFCCDAKKSSFLDAFPMYQKIEKMEPWSAKGRKKVIFRGRPGRPKQKENSSHVAP